MSAGSVLFTDAVRDVSGGNAKIPKLEYQLSGALPVVDQSKEFVAGYTDDLRYSFGSEELPVVVFGDHTRAVKFVDFPFAMGADGVKVLKPNDSCDPKFLYHYLRQAHIPDAGYSRHFKFVKELHFPLPPLPEQRRIAAILDKADALRAKRREAIAKLDQLLQSVFLEMFGDPVTNPKGWPMFKVGEIFSDFVGGKNVACPDKSSSPYRILKVSAVTSKIYRADESKAAPEGFIPAPESIVQKGDLLFSRANTTALVAATAYVWNTPDNIILPDKLWKLRIARDVEVKDLYLWELFKNDAFRYELSKRSSGTSGSMKNISKSKLRMIPMPVPSIELQERFSGICRKVSTHLHAFDDALSRSEDLLSSVQSRAFTGTL